MLTENEWCRARRPPPSTFGEFKFSMEQYTRMGFMVFFNVSVDVAGNTHYIISVSCLLLAQPRRFDRWRQHCCRFWFIPLPFARAEPFQITIIYKWSACTLHRGEREQSDNHVYISSTTIIPLRQAKSEIFNTIKTNYHSRVKPRINKRYF